MAERHSARDREALLDRAAEELAAILVAQWEDEHRRQQRPHDRDDFTPLS